jgi:hypothetical protein
MLASHLYIIFVLKSFFIHFGLIILNKRPNKSVFIKEKKMSLK